METNSFTAEKILILKKSFMYLWEKSMEESKVAGVIVVVVKDGQFYWKKGYGYSDINNNKVDSVKDKFLIAS